ncbi:MULTISPECIES: bis(5'-nucleosyl)-tetraphosphatase (symmetrical) YqeK [unclassified Granulicatella]|uniref:bis(5'-nucleosyl)-tetraphosphatase (symmetrical) YqeK n=1 Tax=unclassified Granulicatella TaxID=2630493 RepID=UPI001074983C|nr:MULTISPECIES: bis(5'-nucleosyl)-tetraphosphatase (symmetrical) YqeK [unclassified Granulicatella]MBF0780091.1 bis(5'-nucleosyl)-tetraphosphatase (symmetrical) YqeK [Granulicatella sp. 19428wC4_WM01]TFU95817.1 HD domain-containing protein [Granulicatella sp. WM01]
MLDEILRQQIIKCVEKQMSQKRFAHVLRVEQKAIELAKRYEVNIASCQLAALLHDYAKEWSMEEYKQAVERYGIPKIMLTYGSNILHGPVAAHLAKEKYEINDDVFQAIYYHTIGHTKMSDIAKVLYIADYTEDGRQFDGVDQARYLSMENLDQAIIYRLKQTLMHLVEIEKTIFPDMIATYNYWISHVKN